VNKEDHVSVTGTVLRKLSDGGPHTSPSFLVSIRGQEGEHRPTQSTRYVYERTVEARTSKKMAEHGVIPAEGDRVRLLVSPIPSTEDLELATMIAVVQSASRMRRSG
jgi:hypothetical protein